MLLEIYLILEKYLCKINVYVTFKFSFLSSSLALKVAVVFLDCFAEPGK